jgi:hypothetical protein
LKAARLIHINARASSMRALRRSVSPARANTPRGQIVFDLLMLVLFAVAFAGAVGYVRACADLTGPSNTGGTKSP